jgi:hypothetical protein
MRAARRGRRGLRLAGAIASLLAIFLSAGGHWAVLQSLAYTRMLVEFAQEDSWSVAVKKTFDERYACPLCPKIRDGYNSERKVPRTLSGERLPEFVAPTATHFFSLPATIADFPLISSLHNDFFTVPPKPPPRVV